MNALQHTRPADLLAATPPVTEGRYLDALLTDMDRHIRPDLGSDRARFLYQAVRRVLVRFIAEGSHRPPFAETGLEGGHDWSGMAPVAAIRQEGALLDAELAWGDARAERIDSASDTAPVTGHALQQALRHLGYPGATVETIRVIVGGRSKQTILLSATGCGDLPRDLVVRRDLLVGSLGTSVVNEFALLQALRAHGVDVPEVYHLETDRELLGTPFLLLRAVSGEATGQITVAPPSREKVLAAARALAGVHRVPVPVMQPMLAHLGSPRTREQTADEIAEWRNAWVAQAREPSPAVDAAFRYLSAHAASVEVRPCFVHGDYSFHNLLFDADRLTAVLDWELAHIGHAAEDLGYIKQAAQAVVPWAEFMAAYHAADGPPIPLTALRFYGLLGTVRLLMKIFIARRLFEEGKTDDILKADVASFWMPRIIQKISREMREIAADGESGLSVSG
jgi:aminoglycoside phosphotransferase (APT) family kinase protein